MKRYKSWRNFGKIVKSEVQLLRIYLPGNSMNRPTADAPRGAKWHHSWEENNGRRFVVRAEENKAVVRRYFEGFHNGREERILEEIMSPDLLEPTRQVTRMLLTAFPDYQLTIEDQIAEADKVATVWTGSETHQVEWESPAGTIAPTGRQVTWLGSTTLRLSEGKISEVIASSRDHLGILQHLGAVAVTGARTEA
jgi:predicted ester cyclase